MAKHGSNASVKAEDLLKKYGKFAGPEGRAASVAAKTATRKPKSLAKTRPAHSAEPGRHRAPESGTGKHVVSSGKQRGRVATEKTVERAKASYQEKRAEHKQQKQLYKSNLRTEKRRLKVANYLEFRPRARMITAEYLVAIILAVVHLFYDDKSYHAKMSRFFVQMTGITGIFFVLSLLASSEKVARPAIAFGGLIDLSIFFWVFKSGGASVINNALGVVPEQGAAAGPGTRLEPGEGSPAGPGTQTHTISATKYDVPMYGGSSPVVPGVSIWGSSDQPVTTSPGETIA